MSRNRIDFCTLTLYLVQSSWIPLILFFPPTPVDFFRFFFHVKDHVSYKENIVSVLPSQSRCHLHISFSCPTALTRASNWLLNRSGENGHLPLLPDLRTKVFSLPRELWVFQRHSPAGWGSSLLCPVCWVSLSWKAAGFCQMFLLHLLRFHIIFLSYAVVLVNYIGWFSNVKPILYSWGKPHLIMIYYCISLLKQP